MLRNGFDGLEAEKSITWSSKSMALNEGVYLHGTGVHEELSNKLEASSAQVHDARDGPFS
jgi:hypothetical protein